MYYCKNCCIIIPSENICVVCNNKSGLKSFIRVAEAKASDDSKSKSNFQEEEEKKSEPEPLNRLPTKLTV